jgi:hypothetical protein
VAAVNIEENGNRTPINYVLPPGINQEIDVASANLRNLNEQSLQTPPATCATGMRGQFPQRELRHPQLQEVAHVRPRRKRDPNRPMAYGDAACSSAWATTTTRTTTSTRCRWCHRPSSTATPYNVWPEANNMIIEFAKLNDVKIQRDQAGIRGEPTVQAPMATGGCS